MMSMKCKYGAEGTYPAGKKLWERLFTNCRHRRIREYSQEIPGTNTAGSQTRKTCEQQARCPREDTTC